MEIRFDMYEDNFSLVADHKKRQRNSYFSLSGSDNSIYAQVKQALEKLYLYIYVL